MKRNTARRWRNTTSRSRASNFEYKKSTGEIRHRRIMQTMRSVGRNIYAQADKKAGWKERKMRLISDDQGRFARRRVHKAELSATRQEETRSRHILAECQPN